ncbi:MAG: tetratricopeptide repeat protein, partial [Candidatus Omnitrophica bacterium]|nr:tetratricopeptide repeat protein [Candidatus Omnitrophota bacterium]
ADREAALLGRAETLIEAGRPDEALQILGGVGEGKTEAPDRVLFLEAMAAKASEAEPEEVLDAFGKVCPEYPESDFCAQALVTGTYTALDLKRPERARKFLESFVDRFPKHPFLSKAVTDLALLCVQAGDFEAAAAASEL